MSLRETIAQHIGPPKWREETPKSDAAQAQRLWDAVVEATGHPLLIHFLSRLIDKADIPARDPHAFARAIQLYSARKIKFFRERPERFQHPLRTIVWGIGDCDDKASFIATSLRSMRIPARLKFMRVTLPDGRKLGHVWPLYFADKKWTDLESVREYPIGYDPEKRAREKGLTVETQIIGDPPDTLHA